MVALSRDTEVAEISKKGGGFFRAKSPLNWDGGRRSARVLRPVAWLAGPFWAEVLALPKACLGPSFSLQSPTSSTRTRGVPKCEAQGEKGLRGLLPQRSFSSYEQVLQVLVTYACRSTQNKIWLLCLTVRNFTETAAAADRKLGAIKDF